MTRIAIALAALSLAAANPSSAQSVDAPPSIPGNFRAMLYDNAGGELFWQRSTDDRGAVRGYEITRNGQSLGIRDALSFYDRSLEPDFPYTFTIAAIDSAGQRSSPATTTLGGATTPPPAGDGPAAPESLRAELYSQMAAELFWNRAVTPGLRYEIKRDGQVVGTTGGTSFYDDGLVGGTRYRVEVFALDSGRRSSASTVEVTTPVLGQPTPLEVRDSFELNSRPEAIDAIESVSEFFDEFLPVERPYFEQRETSIPFSTNPLVEGLTESVLIDIDAAGTGTYRDVSTRQDPDTIRSASAIATRTNTGNSIVWSGTFAFSDSSSGIRRAFEFTTETRATGGRTRLQTGEFRKESSGDPGSDNRPIDVSYDLTTGSIDGSRKCGPVTGTIGYDSVFVERVGSDNVLVDTTTTIDKQVGDRYWYVRETNLDGSLRDEYLMCRSGWICSAVSRNCEGAMGGRPAALRRASPIRQQALAQAKRFRLMLRGGAVSASVQVLSVDEPDEFRALLVNLPENVEFGVDLAAKPDVIVAFYTERSRLDADFASLAEAVFPARLANTHLAVSCLYWAVRRTARSISGGISHGQ